MARPGCRDVGFWDILGTPIYAINNKNREMGDETGNRLQFYIGGYCYFIGLGEKKTIIYLNFIVIVYGTVTINNNRHF